MSKKVPPAEANDERGPRGPRGQRGKHGERGEHGDRGERGEPGITPSALSDLMETVRQLRADAEIQLRRIADLQAQLDITLGEFHRLQKPAEKPGRRLQKRN